MILHLTEGKYFADRRICKILLLGTIRKNLKTPLSCKYQLQNSYSNSLDFSSKYFYSSPMPGITKRVACMVIQHADHCLWRKKSLKSSALFNVFGFMDSHKNASTAEVHSHGCLLETTWHKFSFKSLIPSAQNLRGLKRTHTEIKNNTKQTNKQKNNPHVNPFEKQNHHNLVPCWSW